MTGKGFNEFMLNSGDNQFRAEQYFKPDPKVNAALRNLAREALKQGGVIIIGSMTFEVKKESDCYAGILFSNIGKDKIPRLITCGAKTEEAGKKLWEKLQKNYPEDKAVIASKRRRPPAPFVVDFMPDSGMPPDIDSFRFFMSGICGDFCQCMGWVLLFPEAINEDEAAFPEGEFAPQAEDQVSNSRDFTALINHWIEYGLNTKATADRAEMMDEAATRMEMLGLSENAISEFRSSGWPNFGMKNGRRFPLSDSEKEQIQQLEKNGENLVYAVIRTDSYYGKMTNYIMVSCYKRDWRQERLNIMDRNYVVAHVHNDDCPGWSETGYIEVERLPEGMLDEKMEQCTIDDLVALAMERVQQNNASTNIQQLRPSHRGLIGIKKDNYPLPEELREFNYFYPDAGHVVMAIPESLLPLAIKSGNLDDYECPIPCRYILAKGYRFHDGYVVCDAPYSMDFGVDIDEYWYDE